MSVPLDDGPAPNGDEALPKARLSHAIRWLGVVLVLAVVASVALKVWGLPFAGDEQDRGEAAADADAAVEALREGDLADLGRQLRAGRADPRFAHSFARRATPRDLGDLLATAAEIDFDDLGNSSVDAEQILSTASEAVTYQHTLSDLAAVLSLATHGTGELALPASWTDDLATAMTRPQDLYVEDSENNERASQDLANKQNLLLLLSQGWWSTQFLQGVTAAFWDWEHDAVDSLPDFPGGIASPSTGPWPDRVENGAKYAPSPNGGYLRDGMVALMAALTANPEAAGWAFAGFQSGTRALSLGEEGDRLIGTFSAFVFFEHDYADPASGSDSSGASVAYAALMSALQATGSSYSKEAIGPARDLRVIQDAQESAQSDDAEQDRDAWYERVGHAIAKWGHSALDVVGTLPGLGDSADVVNAIWYGIEGDWENVGLSLAAAVPVFGHAATFVRVARKSGVKAGARAAAKSAADAAKKGGVKPGVEAGVQLLDRDGRAVDDDSEGGKRLAEGTPLGDGTFDFVELDAFLAALEVPVESVVYKFGSTRYELASAQDEVTLLSGPDREAIERALASAKDAPAEQRWYCVSSVCNSLDRFKEERTLDAYEKQEDVEVVRTKVLARVDGVESPRFFDGLVREEDGTYRAIEIVEGRSLRTVDQGRFDLLVSAANPALAALDDEPIQITSVVLYAEGE